MIYDNKIGCFGQKQRILGVVLHLFTPSLKKKTNFCIIHIRFWHKTYIMLHTPLNKGRKSKDVTSVHLILIEEIAGVVSHIFSTMPA